MVWKVIHVWHVSTGKTTLMRDIASAMADKFKQRVVVVDTNGELGGHGSVPHQSLRNIRCLPVHSLSTQHEVLLEALHNHKPGVSCYCSLRRPLLRSNFPGAQPDQPFLCCSCQAALVTLAYRSAGVSCMPAWVQVMSPQLAAQRTAL